jgi:hypothetical protein
MLSLDHGGIGGAVQCARIGRPATAGHTANAHCVAAIVDSIALCMRAVQPENNLALEEFGKAGWKARIPRTAVDQNGNSYTSYTFKKADALGSIRAYETRPVCSVIIETVHEAKRAEIEALLLGKLGGIPSEQQQGFEDLKDKFLNEKDENGGWGNVGRQLSEQLFFFTNTAVTVEIVEIGNTHSMVTNIMAIENSARVNP